MCGILGAMFFPTKKQAKNRLWAAQYILSEAFAESKDRGKDASGAAMIAGDYYAVVKGPWISDEFMLKDKEEAIHSVVLENDITKPFDAFTQICRKKEKELSLIMMHTRAKTQGSEYENKNNHPLLVPNDPKLDATIIGVHNGMIKNDDEIREELKKDKALVTDAEVDSAAIFEVIHNTLAEEEPGLDHMDEVAKWLEGQFAICAISRHHPHRVMFWRDSRPLDYIISEDLGLVFFSSDDKFLKEAISRYNRQRTLFKQRLILPEIGFESRLHVDDWSVLWDTRTILGTFGDKKHGIEEFAKAKRTAKQLYDTVKSPAATAANNWQRGYQGDYQTEKKKAERYLNAISNVLEKDPITSKESNIEDLSLDVEVEVETSIVLTDKETDDLMKKANADSDNTGVVVEGEIITKTVSDDHPEFLDDKEQGALQPDTYEPANDKTNTHPMVSVTNDVHVAAEEEATRIKEGESTIGSLEEAIDRCATEAELDEYKNSLEAIGDLSNAIWEEAFVSGVAWRERIGTTEAEEMADKLQEDHKKLMRKFDNLIKRFQTLRDNRDEMKRLLDKEMEKKAGAQNYVFALRVTLKAIMETLLERVSKKNKEIVVEEVHKALVSNRVISNEDRNSITSLLFPEALAESCKKTDLLSPLKRIDAFLKTLGKRRKSKQ